MARISRKLMFWKFAVPVHVLVLAVSLAVDDGIWKCTEDLGNILKRKSIEAETFFERSPIDLSSEEAFRQSREAWHVNFKHMLHSLDKDLFRVLGSNDTTVDYNYEGPCKDVHPYLFLALDLGALLALLVVFAVFLWQDARTSFGANRAVVFLIINVIISVFIFLCVTNAPMLGLLKRAAHLSDALQGCLRQLKVLQRELIGKYSVDTYFLRANVWDGQRFGVRDPIFGYVVDREFLAGVRRYVGTGIAFDLLVMSYLIYRASVKSLYQWRLAIPSVVCIGVVFPNENRLRRIGSGCIVSSNRGLILTNWHLFQSFFADAGNASPSWGARKPSKGELDMKRIDLNGENEHSSMKTSRTASSPSPIRRHISHPHLRCQAYSDLFPGMKVYIGISTRGHPRWLYEADFVGFESPSAEYTPYGLDLLMLHITKKVDFQDLHPNENRANPELDNTYTFSSLATEHIEDIRAERLQKLEIGTPSQMRSGDEKLRLLGYPASGGYQLSVLTGYFTSMSYDYPDKRRCSWLNINISLPHGGSGGAAVNSRGELVGICTQTKGDLTNIRSITEAEPMIKASKNKIDTLVRKKHSSGFLSPCGVHGCEQMNKHVGSFLFSKIRSLVGAS